MDYPTFSDAVARFRSFLNEGNHRDPIRWVFPNDTLLVSGQWKIRPRPDNDAVEEITNAYQQAVCRRLGVMFAALCRAGDTLWCYIYCPANQIDAEYHNMPDGLKLKVPIHLKEGHLLTDDWEWKKLQTHDQVEVKQSFFG